MRLKDKLVVVTAAASGMGRAGVEVFVREGARVVAVDIDEAALADLAAAVGPAVQTITADLTDRQQCIDLVHKAAEMLGGIDILWSHAGMPAPGAVEQINLDAYDKTIELNMTSSILIAAEATEYIRKRGGGSILFTASTAGLVGSMGSPLYSAQKFAIVGYTKGMAQRVAADNIRVNAVCPGITATPMMPHFFSSRGNAEEAAAFQRRYLESIPLARPGEAIEVANAALFLVSDEASYITGVALPVDGGFTCK